MKKFIKRIALILVLTIAVLEILSRIAIDPIYFWKIDTYKNNDENLSVENIKNYRPEKVDYLFIGSSRVNAAVAEDSFPVPARNVVINAARGYTTGGTHYTALEDCIHENADFLNGAKVFVELPGVVYTENFDENRFTVFEMEGDGGRSEAMPHLLLPYFRANQLPSFFKQSSNSPSVKLDFTAKFLSSLFRTVPFIKEQRKNIAKKIFKSRSNSKELTDEGGIKTDEESIKLAKAQAIKDVQAMIEHQVPLTKESLDSAIISKIHILVEQNGGELILFEMPMHSVLKAYNETEIGLLNTITFEKWASERGIPIINPENFEFSDEDFPDFWHLSLDRKVEFTLDIFEAYKDYKKHNLIDQTNTQALMHESITD